jgi:transmembrane sensor
VGFFAGLRVVWTTQTGGAVNDDTEHHIDTDEQLTDRDRLVDRALTGAATPAELAQLEDSKLFEAIRQQFDSPTDASATDAAWVRLSSTIAKRESRPAGRAQPAVKRWTGVQRWSMAAAILLVIAGTITTWPFVNRARGRRASERVIASGPGHSRTVELGDGTTIILDAGSRLRVPRAFGRRARDLSLDGAAYFVVKHDAAMPFRVHVRDGVVEDVGTRFVVEAYAELPQATVAVAEGSVALQGVDARKPFVALTAGDVGRLAPIGVDRIAQHVDVDSRIAWMRGELVFTDTPLADALPRLSRWFDRDVRLADSTLATRRLTARFRADQPADVVFDGVALALGARVSHQGRVVVFAVAP